MRNAVKATVDAYDGTVTLYAWDEEDPILKAWRSAFPGTVEAEVGDPRRAAGAPALPRGPVQGAALPVRVVPRHRPGRLLPGQRPLGGPGATRTPHSSLQPPYRLTVSTPERRRPAVWSLTSMFVPLQAEQPGVVRVGRLRRRQGRLRPMRVLDSARTSRRRAPADRQRDRRGHGRQPGRPAALHDRATPTGFRQPADAAGRTTGCIYVQPIYAAPRRRGRTTRSCSSCWCRYGRQDVGIGTTFDEASSTCSTWSPAASPTGPATRPAPATQPTATATTRAPAAEPPPRSASSCARPPTSSRSPTRPLHAGRPAAYRRAHRQGPGDSVQRALD